MLNYRSWIFSIKLDYPQLINLAKKANLTNYINYLNPSKYFPTDFKIFSDVKIVFLDFFMPISLLTDQFSYKSQFDKLHQRLKSTKSFQTDIKIFSDAKSLFLPIMNK